MSLPLQMLRRLKDGRALILRNKDAVNLKNYDDFIQWLWDCFAEEEGLFPGANFGRRCQALECLAELASALDLKALKINMSKGVKYLRWFNDSYENNKRLAFRILESIHIPELEVNLIKICQAFDHSLLDLNFALGAFQLSE
jgi:hypothetical protein